MTDKISLRVKDNNLTSCTETRVNGNDPLLTEWRRHEQLTQILGEDCYRLIIGTLLGVGTSLVLDRRGKQTLVAISNGSLDILARS